MKKILSVLIAAAMLLSTLAVCALTVAAADDEYSATNGQFIISTAREDLFMEDDDRTSRPGGVYTDRGFSVNPLDPEYENYKVTWPNNAPYVTAQTLADLYYTSFYMEVTVDAFSFWNITEDEEGNKTYTYTDRWFAFSIWDSVGVMPAQLGTDDNGNDWGNGLEFLIRVHNYGAPNTNVKHEEDITYLSHIEWYDDTETVKPNTRYRPADNTPSIPAGTTYDDVVVNEDGKLVLTFELRFDIETESWTPYINGVQAPKAAGGNDVLTASIKQMLSGEAETIDKELGANKAYIGFTMQSAQQDADCSFTITKIGTKSAEENAEWDYEDLTEGDSIEARQRDNAVAEIDPRDPTADPADPAFVITGGVDTYKNVRSISGACKFQTLEESGNLQITSNNGAADPMWRPFNDQSYDLRDYPYIALIVKNWCTCTWTDITMDGVPDPQCIHSEKTSANYTAGDYINSGAGSVTGIKLDLDYSTTEKEEYKDAAGNTYSIYIYDMTPILETEGKGFMNEEQRIHGVYLSFSNIKLDIAGRNVFDMVAVAHLANEEGAIEWAKTYVEDNIDLGSDENPEGPEDPDETDAPETNAPETNAPETDAPAGPTIPDPDSDLSIEEAVNLGAALGNGNYTDGMYFVEGTVVEVTDAEKGVMTITDDDGNTIVINGMFNDGGDVAYNELFDQPIAGDWVYVYGAIGCNNGVAEIKDAFLMDYILNDRPDETQPVETQPVETQPVETQPVETQPVETQPVETQPVETQPKETEPVETQPKETEPKETEPVETQPKETEPKTEEKTEEKTEAETEPKAPAREGCGSVAGFGAMAIVAVAAVALVSFKKKED